MKKKSKNIISDIYNANYLNPERLQYILENKNSTLKIPTSLIKNSIQNKNKELLDVIFKYSKFYDNEIILKLCFSYKYKKTNI